LTGYQDGRGTKNKMYARGNECYICKRTENEVQEFLLPNLDRITKRYDSEIDNLRSKLQIKEDSEKLEMLNKEREVHLRSLERQKRAIKNLKHHEVFREVQSATEYLGYRIKVHDGWGKDASQDLDNISKTPFSVHVCAICGTLVWWESGNVSLRFYDDGIMRLRQIEELASISPNPRTPFF
jgi:hypothetical protein